MSDGGITKLQHRKWGPCELVRIEATDWIVRVQSTGVVFRVPPEIRSHFERIHEESLPVPDATPPITSKQPPSVPAQRARRVIESLRVGLPSLDGSTRQLAVGFDQTQFLFSGFMRDVKEYGGGAMLLKGQYGQGKTFALTMLEDFALESGFATARTEIDATENRLNKPHHIYHDFLRNLRLPDSNNRGGVGLALKTRECTAKDCTGSAYQRMQWLEKHLDCFPVSWLFSDPALVEKQSLIGLLECDPNYPVRVARNVHAISPPVGPRQWPAFSAGTQGDFASFILSGIGRLTKLLGYHGLILIMDEMEKWTELNWMEQSRAGNLLGGLIWGATAEDAQRGCRREKPPYSGNCDHPAVLTHSGRCGGYPFTTKRRSHLGIAIAMTPRSENDPALLWSQYGLLLVGDVPSLTKEGLRHYSKLVAPYFADAFGLAAPSDETVMAIANVALSKWKAYGDLTTRTGVQSVIEAFDEWRHRC